MSSDSLTGRVAVVTGAGGRLGPVWTAALEQAGARVARIDLEEAVGDDAWRADVTSRGRLEAVRGEIEDRLGGPATILVNNAGIDQPPAVTQTARLEDIDLDDFRSVLDVNLAGSFNAAQVFGPAMADAGGGSIVNIGSIYASIAPDPALYEHLDVDPPFLKPPAYGASKAGVLNLTRYLARLWGPLGIRVNALSPGGVAAGQDDEFVRKYTARTPLGRMAAPDDLAGPLLFLASDASSYLTGHELRVDGGFTA